MSGDSRRRVAISVALFSKVEVPEPPKAAKGKGAPPPPPEPPPEPEELRRWQLCEVVTLSNAEGPTIARAWLPEDATEGDELVLEIADASVVETLAVAPLEPLTLKVRVVARPS